MANGVKVFPPSTLSYVLPHDLIHQHQLLIFVVVLVWVVDVDFELLDIVFVVS